MWSRRSYRSNLSFVQGKKRQSGSAIGQLPGSQSNMLAINKSTSLLPSFDKLPVLDYILDHAVDDHRPFLQVHIYGRSMLGLLDSGASRTVLGGIGWNLLRKFCRLNTATRRKCTVANGRTCHSIGTVCLPITLRERTRVFEVLVVPSMTQSLILGIDFWMHMGIIPDLNAGEWRFRKDATEECAVSAICSYDSLTQTQQEQLSQLIDQAFQGMEGRLGCTHLIELQIKTNSPPIKQRYYPISPAMQKHVNAELDEMLAQGIVEPSTSPWSSPIVMVKKSDGRFRFCVNYKKLNSVSECDAYPIPWVSAILDKLRDARYLTTLDIKSAYWQIPVAKQSRPLTAFTVPNRGLFHFCRMPFGLHSAPAVWQRLIDTVLGADLDQYVFVYLDDVIICTSTFEQHLEVLDKVIRRINDAGLTLNKDKCNFCKPELRYLGYMVNSGGLMVDPQKVEAIVQIPPPRTVTEVRRIVGLASWYRRFIPNFSTVVSPLTDLTRKNRQFEWSPSCQQALDTVKEHLISAPVLSCPDFELPFSIQTDASDYGLGAVLTQVQDGQERAICYLSRSLTKNERKYTTTEKECLAVIFAIEKLRPYVEGTCFTVVTDHYSLKWLFDIKDPVGRIARWALRLQQYDFCIVHRKGAENVVPDALSRAVPAVDCISLDQTKDTWYRGMITRVTTNPDRYPLWQVENNHLYFHKKREYPELAEPSSYWLKVVPKENRTQVIRQYHDPPTCGHLGIYKTTARIQEKYYWPKMKSDVARYIARCEVCLGTKPLQKPPAGKMLSAQVTATRPWELVCADLVGPLPRSSAGYNYILSVCDCFTKFVLLFPLRSATAVAVTRIIEDNVILVFGAPSRLIVDNGVQFQSGKFRETMEKYHIEIKFLAVYHPQANPVERVHRVIKTMLTSYIKDNHREWDKYLAKVAFAIRSARHEVTGHTPNFLNFGREVQISGDWQNIPTGADLERHVQKIEVLDRVYKDVVKRLKAAYEKSRQAYNLRRRDETFTLNQKVWKRNPVLSDAVKGFTAKFAPRFVGPCIVQKILSPWTYELVDANGRNLGAWHAKDLKAHPPDTPDD